ncbi:MAG: isoprenylcysteine carboxylmethyltransferase family protein [Synergistaceae bacterium]|nr:isoprenylcysteine carboxylmethyltransferase family protein [Synergistaceae bacterium]
MMELVARHRTKFSQLLGCALILVFAFSDKKLEHAAPFATGVMFILGCILVGCAMVGRLWCAQYIAGYKTSTLVTVGPYSVCRNPLYFFSFLGGIGAGLCSESLTIIAVILIVFAAIYPITIKTEERKLSGIFGEAYSRYSANVPRFIPDISKFREPAEYVVNTKVYRRELVDAMYFLWIVGFFEFLEVLIEAQIIPTYFSMY